MIDVRSAPGDEWLVTVRGSVITHQRVRVTKAGLAQSSEHGLFRERLFRRLRYAEIDYFRHRHPVVQCHQKRVKPLL